MLRHEGESVRLALGTVQFGLPYGIANTQGQVSGSEAFQMLRLASASGIDVLDTAIAYGESECRLGEAGVRDFRVITKLPAVPSSCSGVGEWVAAQLAASMARLRMDRVYGLLLHRPQQLLEKDGAAIYRTLRQFQESGQIEKIGFSIYDPGQLDALYAQYLIDLVQVPFNLVDGRLLTSGWLPRLKDAGVEVHVRSAFLQGLLLLPPDAIPAKFARWSPLWRRWQAWLEDSGVPAVQACLAHVLSFPEIDRVVVGADSVQQLQQIVDAANRPLSIDLPNLQCADELLINPALWGTL